MNKLGKLEEKVRHNYVVHTGGMSFCSGKWYIIREKSGFWQY